MQSSEIERLGGSDRVVLNRYMKINFITLKHNNGFIDTFVQDKCQQMRQLVMQRTILCF